MKLAAMHPIPTALYSLLLLVTSTRAGDGYYNSYCSSENTGSDYSPQYNTYNSMGSCSTNCNDGGYAFAILQWKDCWCSNYIPAKQDSVSECNESCPGYGSDQCGNQAAGLYGYVALSVAPSGTAGVSPTKPTPTPTPTPTTAPVSPTVTQIQTRTVQHTVQQTVTETPIPSTSIMVISPSSPAGSTSSPSSTATTTVSGQGTTQTVTTTPTVISPGSSSHKPTLEKKQGLSPGATAGVVVGALVGAAALILGAFFLYRRRQTDDNESGTDSQRSRRSPKRKGSVLSRTGLLGGARPQSMTETNYDDPFNDTSVTHSNSVRHSMMFGAGAPIDGVQDAGPLANSSRDGSERRPSRPLVYDQRLNPSALFANHDNGSRVSMQDQNDYSRPLGVANPDFRYSFDSR